MNRIQASVISSIENEWNQEDKRDQHLHRAARDKGQTHLALVISFHKIQHGEKSGRKHKEQGIKPQESEADLFFVVNDPCVRCP